MERIRIALPDNQASFQAFLRHHASADAGEKTWVCPTCGTMLPREIKPGLYLRRSCTCEERRREEQEVEAIRQRIQAEQRAQTFAWIGQEWVEPNLERLTFATFARARQAKAFDQAHTFAHAPRGTLALMGTYGTGKTHLLVAIANALREANQTCLYVSAVAFFEAIADRIHHEREYQSLLQRAARTPLLLIDDLDKPKPSEFRESIYYFLFNQRCRAGLPLAITCNCHPQELDRWIGGAARSRLMPGLVPAVMNGPDYRMQQI